MFPNGGVTANGGGEAEIKILTNPMTAGWDLIVGKAGVGTGSPTRFPVGTSGQFLRVTSVGAIAWETYSGAGGSLTVKEVDSDPNISNVTTLVFPNGSVTDNGSGEAEISVLTNPMVSGYDLIYGAAGSGDPTRFGLGTAYQSLRVTSSGTAFAWETINMQALYTYAGTLVVGANALKIPNATGRTLKITKVYLIVGTAPTGAAVLVDIHKNGTTIFTNQGNRPTIADGATSGNTTTIEVSDWADGEYLTMEIDQIGSTAAGSDLTVAVVYS